jgi:hypothetical protein
LFEDGTLLARVSADPSFLAWGRTSDQFPQRPKLNPLAAIEVTTSFAYLYKRLLERLKPQPNTLRYRLEIKDAIIEGRKLYLTPHGLNSISWASDDERYEISQANTSKELTREAESLRSDVDHIAYELVKRFYLMFNMPTDKIPYTKTEAGVHRIDVNAFSRRS